MKVTALIGLSIAVALVASLSLAASLASGTVLCQLKEEACSLESTLPSETSITASLQSATSANFGPAVCKQSTLKAKTLSKEAESLPVTVSEATFGECTLAGNACTVTATHLPYEGSIKYSELGNGSLPITSGKEGSPGGTLNCAGGSIKCTYTLEANLAVTGGEPATLVASNEPMKKTEGSFLCSAESSWSATYKASAPEPMYVAQQAKATNTLLCKTIPNPVGGTLECTPGDAYSGLVQGSAIAGLPILFKTGGKEISCTKHTFEGTFKAEGTSGAKGGVTKLAYETAGGVCTSNFAGTPNVKVEVKVPFDRSKFTYIAATPAEGAFAMEKNAGDREMAIEIQEKVALNCNYKLNVQMNNLSNGTKGKISVLFMLVEWLLKAGEPKACPSVLNQEAYVDIRNAANTPLYIAEK